MKITNDTTDATVHYAVKTTLIGPSGCLVHRKAFEESFPLAYLTRVELKVYKTKADCILFGKSIYEKTCN